MLYLNSNLKNLKSFCGNRDAFDYCVSELVRTVDRQSKNLGSNPGTIESVFLPQKDFRFFKFEFNLHLFAIIRAILVIPVQIFKNSSKHFSLVLIFCSS